jgi:8-oxo-dGTP diphosphatase
MSGRPEVAVGAIVTDAQGRVLLIKRGHPPAQGRWTIPGGRVERGETLQQALLRELLAETGLVAKPGPLAEVFEYIDDRYHYIILDYVMSDPHGELRAGEDATDARFVAMHELDNYETTDGLAAVLTRALNSGR